METKPRYFTKICYNLDEYIEFVDNLTREDIERKLISVIEKGVKIILTFKDFYTEL